MVLPKLVLTTHLLDTAFTTFGLYRSYAMTVPSLHNFDSPYILRGIGMKAEYVTLHAASDLATSRYVLAYVRKKPKN